MRINGKVISRIVVAAIIAAATVSFIFIKPVPKPQPLPKLPPRLNLMLTNEMSDTEELAGLDRKVRNYLRKWFM